MESVMWLTSALAPWIGFLSVGIFALISTVYFLSAAKTPIKRVPVTCPETEEKIKVLMKVNIFRNPRKIGKGLDVVSCPLFCREEILCSKGCALESGPQQIHRMAAERHLEKTARVVSEGLHPSLQSTGRRYNEGCHFCLDLFHLHRRRHGAWQDVPP